MVDSKLGHSREWTSFWTFTSACLYIIWAGNLNELASVVLGGPTLSLHTGSWLGLEKLFVLIEIKLK